MYANKVAQGVAEVRNDPAFANNTSAQMAEVTKRFGAQGLKMWGDQLSNEAKVAQIGLYGAEAKKTSEQATAAELQNRITNQTLPTQLQMPAAQLAHLQGQTAALGAEANLAQARVPQVQAATAQTQAATPGVKAEADIKQQEAAGNLGGSTVAATGAEADLRRAQASTEATRGNLLDQQFKNMQEMFKTVNPQDQNSPTMFDNILKANNVTRPEDIAAARQALISDPTGKAFNKFIQDFNNTNRRMGKQELLPSDMRKTLDNAAATSSNLAPFLEESKNSGPAFIQGFKAYLAKKGIGNDPDLIATATAGEQNMGHFAESGTGFGGVWRMKLGADVTPQVNHSPIYNVLVTGQISQSMVDRLQSLKTQLEDKPQYKSDLAAVDAQLEKYQSFLNDSRTLKWAYDTVDKQGTGSGKPHFYYRGQEVDQNLRPVPAAQSTLLDPGKTYKLLNGDTAKGDVINQMSLGYMKDGRSVAGTGVAPLNYVVRQ